MPQAATTTQAKDCGFVLNPAGLTFASVLLWRELVAADDQADQWCDLDTYISCANLGYYLRFFLLHSGGLCYHQTGYAYNVHEHTGDGHGTVSIARIKTCMGSPNAGRS